jgi:Ca2+-binding EF-hand superfamily protein
MKRQFWSVVIGVGLAAAATAQPPSGGEYDRPPNRPDESGGPHANAMFSAIDADADGVITIRELRKAVAALKQLDLDKDGKITLAEVNDASKQADPATAAAGMRGAGGTGFQPGDPRPTGPDLMQYDRNHDGQLSPDEVPTQLMGLLRGADRNGDGKLDPQELQQIQQRIRERARGQSPLPPGMSVGPQGVNRTSTGATTQ